MIASGMRILLGLLAMAGTAHADAKIDWPWVAASWNSVFSEFRFVVPSPASHRPHEVEITLGRGVGPLIMSA